MKHHEKPMENKWKIYEKSMKIYENFGNQWKTNGKSNGKSMKIYENMFFFMKIAKIYEKSMHKLMSNRTGGEKCDMQSDRENTYDSSFFSNIEVIKNNENRIKII